MTWWRAGSDDAVSDVVGYVLVTGISVMAITIVLLTSGPALEEIQSSQQHDSMIRYFHDLDQGVSMLLSGAPAGSTPVWRVAMPSGSISIDQGTGHIWAVATDKTSTRGLAYRAIDDGDNTFEIQFYAGSAPADFQATATKWDAGKRTILDQPTITDLGTGNEEYQVELTNGGAVPIEDGSIEVRFYDGPPTDNAPFSRVWLVDSGAVEWSRAGSDFQRILYQNTAILALRDEGQVLHNDPRIRAPEDTGSNGEHVFLRIARINGTVSLGGEVTASVLISSAGNHPRYSVADVERVQVYPPTSTTTAWQRFLTNANLGYTYAWDATPTPGGPPAGDAQPVAFRDKSSHGLNTLSLTFVEADIKMVQKGGT